MRVRQCEECGIEYGTETIDSETFRHVFPEIVELGAKNAELKRLARRWQQEYFNEKKQLEQKIAENAELRELIEQMREALNVLVASATPSGPLWHGSAEMQIARAALSAAERISE